MSILAINAGSSSVKFGLYRVANQETILTGLVDWTAKTGTAELVIRVSDQTERRLPVDVSDHAGAVAHSIRVLMESNSERIDGVGHRVVHGGSLFHDSTRIDARVKQGIHSLEQLAPLHNAIALQVIDAADKALADVPHFAVFDTSFFATLPAEQFVYPLPYAWYTDWGIRRFGFHGISHSYCATRAVEFLGSSVQARRLIICHLGNGCSASAVRDGKAVATTMGFTPMEGLMMGTRGGSIDPSILLHVQRLHGQSTEQLEEVLNHGSGLLGVSGVASDYRRVEEAADAGNERARLALAMFANRVRQAIGALAVTLGGVDVLVFTAGVGENSARLRASTCAGLECLGLRLDVARNATASADADLAAPDSARILALHTREELMIAREVACWLSVAK